MRLKHLIVLTSIFLLLGCQGQPQATAKADPRLDDLKMLRQRQIDFLTGHIGNVDGQGRAATVAAMDLDIEALLAKDWPGATFTEADQKNLDDLDKNIVNQSQYTVAVSTHLTNLAKLSAAYHVTGSRYYHDPTLKARVIAELDRALQWIKPDALKPGYWSSWYFTISKGFCETALLVDDYIEPPMRERVVAGLGWLMPEMTLSGVNAVWEGRNHYMFALLTDDIEKVDLVMSRVEPQLQYRNESGVLEDYAYQFHGRFVYTGAYGAGYAQAVSQFLFLTDGSAWEIAQPRREVMINYLLNHAQWVSVGGTYDISVVGRAYMGRRSSLPLAEALIYMSFVESDQQQAIRQAAARLVEEMGNLPIAIAPMADVITAQAAQPLQGFRYYHTSDFAVCRNSDFHTSVKMYSRRMQDYEYLGYGGGIEGHNLSNGLTYFTRTGREWWGRSKAIEKLDYERLPGTTVRINAHPAEPFNYGTSRFAGGAGTDDAGMVAFELIPAAGDFAAKKSYFFFDRGFVALGSAIRSTAAIAQPINTTVTQWAAPAADAPLYLSSRDEPITQDTELTAEDITWAWCDNVGYVFPRAVSLNVRRADVLTTLWLDHGNDPQGDHYAYIVLPQMSLDATKAFALNPTVTILMQNEKAHVVRDNLNQATGMTLWQAGSAGLVTADHPVVAYQQARGKGVVLAIENPLHTNRRLNLLVDHTGPVTQKPDEVTAIAKSNQTLLQVRSLLGRQYRIALGEIGGELAQPVRQDMAAFYQFRVEAQSDEQMTWLTVHLPEEAVESGFRLSVHGYKGHYLYNLEEKDIVEKIDEKTIKYRFPRFETDNSQTFGSFRMQIHTPLKGAVAYFSVPRYDEKNEDLKGRNYEVDRNRPPNE